MIIFFFYDRVRGRGKSINMPPAIKISLCIKKCIKKKLYFILIEVFFFLLRRPLLYYSSNITYYYCRHELELSKKSTILLLGMQLQIIYNINNNKKNTLQFCYVSYGFKYNIIVYAVKILLI